MGKHMTSANVVAWLLVLMKFCTY